MVVPLLIPPVVEKTNGVNDPCSISRTCWVFSLVHVVDKLLAKKFDSSIGCWGYWKTLTSINAFSNLLPQKPLHAMSSCALSSWFEVRCDSNSPIRGSVDTFWHTFVRRDAVLVQHKMAKNSRMVLCCQNWVSKGTNQCYGLHSSANISVHSTLVTRARLTEEGGGGGGGEEELRRKN